jgi:hypothetical protein
VVNLGEHLAITRIEIIRMKMREYVRTKEREQSLEERNNARTCFSNSYS